jgi:hypothetical protein
MRLAIVGSRSFTKTSFAFEILDRVRATTSVDLVVSGGAAGADTIAELWARARSIATRVFKPDWTRNGRRAGFLRNVSIVTNADKLIAFWDGVSRGTLHSINLARLRNIPVQVIHV